MTKEKRRGGTYWAVWICGGGFLIGALSGGAIITLMDQREQNAFSTFFLGYRSALAAGMGLPDPRAVLWNSVKWPVLAFLLGFTSLGVVMVPFLFLLRGFFLSCCVAGLSRALAGRGVLLALALFGVEASFALPILFVLGTQSWEAARGLNRHIIYQPKLKSPYVDGYWTRSLLCALLLGLGTLAQSAALPPLLKALLG